MRGLVIDNFAGGGGASTGIEAALGRPIDIAINHDAEAIAMHKANHPHTKHYCQSIMSVDPLEVTQGQPVDLVWFSPDCKHFSKAKGGTPVQKNIRDLAWVVIHWVERLGPKKPKVIMLENVEEFRSWGPLHADGNGDLYPDPDRKGETFDKWVRKLRKNGYKVEWRELRACDYGAPTTRKRLFMIARCDGAKIVWPNPTHGAGRPLPHRTAASIIDWSIPCPSIFTRKRPLKPATCRRIAVGIQRYVLDAAKPFIVPVTHHGSDDRVYGPDKPIPTVTAANRGEMALVTPTLITSGYGEREGQSPRVPGLGKPLGTVVASGVKHALVSPHIIPITHTKASPTAHDPNEPLKTITTAKGGEFAVVAAFMAQHNTGVIGHKAEKPLSTIVSRGTQQNLVTSNLIKLRNNAIGQPVDNPIGTLTAGGGHFAEVRAFLIKYYGNEDGGHGLLNPLGTVTTKDRFGVVTCIVDGVEYAIADIGMRMLAAHELFAAQGFPPDYQIDLIGPNGRPLTKTAQVRMCGNSVCPPLPEALVRANLSELCARSAEAA